ncbi:MAG: hypothetical protein ACRCXT_00740 [Paraclostridium sp.]
MKSLMDRLKLEMSNGLPFMEGREKADQILDLEITIKEFGFMDSEDGKYSAYIIEENDDCFYFGGTLLTERFTKITEVFNEKEIEELKAEGIKIKLTTKKSVKSKRPYTSVEFI